MFRHILVPLDGSRFGSRAIRYATDIARRFGAEITLLQVAKRPTPIVPTTGISPGIADPSTAEMAAEAAIKEEKSNVARARRYLSGKARGIKSKNIKTSYQVTLGDPSRSIMDFSRKKNVDLIVMTTHGKGGLKRAVMGSVADAVIRESGKPVLVVRPGSRSK